MKFSAKQLRAIGDSAKRYDRRLSLCTYPFAYFLEKDSDKTIKIHIKELVKIYDQNRREDTKERARVRRLEKARK